MSMPERGSTEWAQMKERPDSPEDRAEREDNEREQAITELVRQMQRRIPPGENETVQLPPDYELTSMVENYVDRYGLGKIVEVLRYALREAWPPARHLTWELAELHYEGER